MIAKIFVNKDEEKQQTEDIKRELALRLTALLEEDIECI